MSVVTGEQTGQSPQERFDAIAVDTLIDEGKKLATQRFSAIEPHTSVPDGIYVSAGYGDDARPTSYGQGVQAAATYRNIVQLNQAAEDRDFLYMFDRALELGNDVILVPVCFYDDAIQADVVEELDEAASQVGYELADENGAYRLYHYEAPDTFGVVSMYRAIGIGESTPTISLMFPAVEETESTNLNDYTFEELSQYEEVFLSGFTYDDRDSAEDLVRRLSEAGVRVVIMADGIPSDEHSGSKTFLGVDCEAVTFHNSYPTLDTTDGELECDLFPGDYSQWRTVYLNGLDEIWGTVHEDDRDLAFYGTVENENIVMIGLNLTFFYSLTHDGEVGNLLSHAIDMGTSELPERTVVPIEIEYDNESITITAPADDVNTTLAFHDIFSSEQDITSENYLLHVNEGETVIRLSYLYFCQGLAMSVVGIVGTVVFLVCTRRGLRKRTVQVRMESNTDVAGSGRDAAHVATANDAVKDGI